MQFSLLCFIGSFVVIVQHSEARYIERCRKVYSSLRGVIIRNTTGIESQWQGSDEEITNDFHLVVSNSGPAVLDSDVNFRAKMYDSEGHLADSKFFTYLWSNNANDKELRMEDDFDANLTQVYLNEFVLPSKYNMKVCVYDKQPVQKTERERFVLVAEGETEFHLTSTLNGKIELKQKLEHKKSGKIFATEEPIEFSVNLTDHFPTNIHTSTFFTWYDGKTLLARTMEPKYKITLNKTASQKKLSVNVRTVLLDKDRHSLMDYDWQKVGEWKEDIELKNVIKNVTISGSTSVDVGKVLNLTVYFQGSNPTVVCWEICKAHQNESYCGNKTCGEPVTGNRKWYQVTESLPETGQYQAQLTIENDVSLSHYRTGVINVYNKESYHSPSYTIPVVFICLGVVIVIVASVYVVRLRKKPHVETADFDFHPSLNENKLHPMLSVFKNTISRVLRPKTDSSPMQQPFSTARTYGSLDTDPDTL